ncbi:MAG: hypothetical protein WBG95_15305 [Sulfitobacter sp.]
MLLVPLLPLITTLSLAGDTQPLCRIDAVENAGVYDVTANVQTLNIGTLTYRVDTTVQSGGNKSRSINGGEMEIQSGLAPVTVWKGRMAVTDASRITVIFDAEINNIGFFCELELP